MEPAARCARYAHVPYTRAARSALLNVGVFPEVGVSSPNRGINVHAQELDRRGDPERCSMDHSKNTASSCQLEPLDRVFSDEMYFVPLLSSLAVDYSLWQQALQVLVHLQATEQKLCFSSFVGTSAVDLAP